MMATPKKRTSQSEKFKEAARALKTDSSERRFNERLEKIAKHKAESAKKTKRK
jgi:hypothetical protein